jgi:hypothetical protein
LPGVFTTLEANLERPCLIRMVSDLAKAQIAWGSARCENLKAVRRARLDYEVFRLGLPNPLFCFQQTDWWR